MEIGSRIESSEDIEYEKSQLLYDSQATQRTRRNSRQVGYHVFGIDEKNCGRVSGREARREVMTKSTRTIIEKTLKHYDEMIEWAKGQKPMACVDNQKMYAGIEQDWFDYDCPLCQKFFKGALDPSIRCSKCPLYLRYGKCGRSTKNSWTYMFEARTWKTWIRHATLMRRQVESLLEEVKPDAK